MRWHPVTEDHDPTIMALRRRIEKLEAENKYLREVKFSPMYVDDDAVELKAPLETVTLPLSARATVNNLGHGVKVNAFCRDRQGGSIAYSIYLDQSQLNYPDDARRLMLFEVLKQALIGIGQDR